MSIEKKWDMPLDYTEMMKGGEPVDDEAAPISKERTEWLINNCLKQGRKWQARYVEMFGADHPIPNLDITEEELEEEYKMYVELGHDYNWYNPEVEDELI